MDLKRLNLDLLNILKDVLFRKTQAIMYNKFSKVEDLEKAKRS